MNDIQKLQKLIDQSSKIVFFGGAGVSTESGIPDYRSVDGLYHMHYKYPPEIILSHDFFMEKTDEFYHFYKDKMNCIKAQPNACHNYLKKLEDEGKLLGIVTQNIDGLHTKAGNKKVYELHGSIYRNYCMECGKFYDAKKIFDGTDSIPYCECGGLIKPDVVLYNEGLNENTVTEAINAIENADLIIVAGTSLTVYPAASFLSYYRGKDMVIINRDETDYDRVATLVIHKSLKDIFPYLK